MKLRVAIDAAEGEFAALFAARPKVEASIRETLGTSYLHLGSFDSPPTSTSALDLARKSWAPTIPTP